MSIYLVPSEYIEILSIYLQYFMQVVVEFSRVERWLKMTLKYQIILSNVWLKDKGPQGHAS